MCSIITNDFLWECDTVCHGLYVLYAIHYLINASNKFSCHVIVVFYATYHIIITSNFQDWTTKNYLQVDFKYRVEFADKLTR